MSKIDNARVFKGTPAQNIIRNANGRTVRYDSKVYLIRAVILGQNLMASAEEMKGSEQPIINLYSDLALAKTLRGLVETLQFS